MNTPKIGQSVFIPFVTGVNEATGKVEKLMGAAVIPFDFIDAVYAETDKSKSGKPVYSVRVKSGDAVRIIEKNERWEAVA